MTVKCTLRSSSATKAFGTALASRIDDVSDSEGDKMLRLAVAVSGGRDAVIVSRPRHTTPHAEIAEAVQSGEPA